MFIELTSDWVNEWNGERGSPPNDLLGLLSFLQDQPLVWGKEAKLRILWEVSIRFL